MANERIGIFSQTDAAEDLSRFTPKSRGGRDTPPAAEIARMPEDGKFVSREKPLGPRRPVRVLSDKTEQFNSRVSPETRQGFDELVIRLRKPRGDVLVMALEALKRELGQGSSE